MTTESQSAVGGTAASEHRTVNRVMTILELVVAAEPQGLRLADLSDQMQAPKSTIHGLTKGLVATGYLREFAGRYYLGSAVSLLSPGAPRVPAAFHRALDRLRDRWQETAVLGMLVGDSVVNVAISEPDQLIRASPVLNVRRPLWPTSYGKNFLAHMASTRRDAYLRRHFASATELAPGSARSSVREAGIAFNREENIPGLYRL